MEFNKLYEDIIIIIIQYYFVMNTYKININSEWFFIYLFTYSSRLSASKTLARVFMNHEYVNESSFQAHSNEKGENTKLLKYYNHIKYWNTKKGLVHWRPDSTNIN